MTVMVRAGTYYLDETLSFSPKDSGSSCGTSDLPGIPRGNCDPERWGAA